jgi:O-antigen biosynthesis protein
MRAVSMDNALLTHEIIRSPGMPAGLPGIPVADSPDRIGELQAEVAWHREALLWHLETLATSPASLSRRALRLRRKVNSLLSRWMAAGTNVAKFLAEFPWIGPQPRRQLRTAISDPYAAWIMRNEAGKAELAAQRRARWDCPPRIVLLLPIAAAPHPGLAAAIRAVVAQTYRSWELRLITTDRWSESAKRAADLYSDPRICVLAAPDGSGLADLCNRGLAAAGGEYVAMITAADRLPGFALFETAQAIRRNPQADLIYSDEDCLSASGMLRSAPLFKPDWSPDTLQSRNYIGDLCVLRRALIERVGGFREEFDDALGYDLVLRASEQARQIVHIPKVLYHRRVQDATIAGEGAPALFQAAGRRALAQHLQRKGRDGTIEDGLRPGTFCVRNPLSDHPLVSILIPTKDQPRLLQQCIESLDRSSYRNYEIVLIDNGSERPETKALYDSLGQRPHVRMISWPGPFNFAAINNDAAHHARGEMLLLLNDDTEAVNPDWMERMLELAIQPEVGAVGAKLLYGDGTIQHAGVILGICRLTGHYQKRFPGNSAGYGNRLVCIQNLSAVTGACLMMRRSVFHEAGGFDVGFRVSHNDIDLCLKVRRLGYQVLWTPYAELRHHESATRGCDDATPEKQALACYEDLRFRWKWRAELDRGDPFYSPNLTHRREDCSSDG